MAKKKPHAYTLKLGVDHAYKRTIVIRDKRDKKKVVKEYQITFEPGIDVELSDDELEQCQDLISVGHIVPATRDEKGRLRMEKMVRREVNEEMAALEKQIAGLEEENAELAQRLRTLEEELGVVAAKKVESS